MASWLGCHRWRRWRLLEAWLSPHYVGSGGDFTAVQKDNHYRVGILSNGHITAKIYIIGQGAGFVGWYGPVDEVSIYQTALSSSQVAAHYAAGI